MPLSVISLEDEPETSPNKRRLEEIFFRDDRVYSLLSLY